MTLKRDADAKDKRDARVFATRDHFFPLASGGRKGRRNFVLACRPCNEQKGSIDPRVIVTVWHKLDNKSLLTFIDGLDAPVRKASIAGRIKALLQPKNPPKKKLN